MARPKKYATDEERTSARKLQKLAWFHWNATTLNAKRRQAYRDDRASKGQLSVDLEDGPRRNVKCPVKGTSSRAKPMHPLASTSTAESRDDGTHPLPLATASGDVRDRSQRPSKRRKTVEKQLEFDSAAVLAAARVSARCVKPCKPGTSKYWVTRSITALKGKLAQYSIIQNEDLDYADYCTFWEEALDDFLPAGGLQRWGTMLFKELTRSSPDPELDTRTSAKRECVRLSREIEGLGHVVAGLARNVFNIDPFDKDRLTLRAQKIDRTASMLSNIIDELIILHDSGLNHLAEYERDGMLNYQDFRM